MTKKIFIVFAVLFVSVTSVSFVYGWGNWAHDHINKGAVLALPPEMGMFFYNHADFIVQESMVADLRKHTDSFEKQNHFIKLEKYNYTNREMMPRTLKEATAIYGADSLSKYGIIPWAIEDAMTKLTEAFKKKRKTEILFYAADLGHYIADAYQPLHTTINGRGQLTGQDGVNHLFQRQLPELFGKNYNLYTGEAHYIKDVEKATWDIIDSSRMLIKPLLSIENKMRKDNPIDKQYVLDSAGQPAKGRYGFPIHTYEYAHVYHELLNGMVEKQIRASLKCTADFWYTAWVNAGKPDLSDLDPKYVTENNRPLYMEDMRYWKKGKVSGCKSEKEY